MRIGVNRRWFAAGASFSLCLWAAAVVAQGIRTEEVAFETNVVRGTTAGTAVRLSATLFMPAASGAARTRPMPVVVITPSSGGVKAEREVFYAQKLAEAGIAGLVVDSFRSRGLINSIYDQTVLTSWATQNDAWAAFRWLVQDGRFRKDRIAVSGVSKGGIAALQTALNIRRRWSGISDLTFAAHVPIAPDCGFLNRSMETTGAPILFMLAELDDQVSAASCVNYAERLRVAGNSRIEIRVYEGAHHAWELIGDRPYFDAKAENYAKCRAWVEDDGTIVAAADGTRIPAPEYSAWAKKTCMTLGTHCCGGTATLRQQAADDMIRFLKRHGF
jgi:dienelactone hydrolase